MDYNALQKELKIKPDDRELCRKELDYWIRSKSKSRFIPIRLLNRIPFSKRKRKKMEVNECQVIAHIK